MSKFKNYDPESMFEASSLVRTQDYRVDFDIGVHRDITYVPGDSDESKDPKDIKNSVQRFAFALGQAEGWARSLKHEFTDEEALRLAKKLYKDIFLVVSTNCLRVYIARVEAGADETAQERRKLERLRESPDFDKQIEAAREAWVDAFVASLNGDDAVENAQVSALDVQLYVDKHMMAAALLKTQEELPEDAAESVFKETLMRHLESEAEDDDYYYSAYVQFHVRGLLDGPLNPNEMPLEQLRKFAGIRWLEKQGDVGTLEPNLRLGTSKIFAHQNTFLNRKTETSLRETLRHRKNNRSAEVVARSRPELPKGAERPSRTDYLQKMTSMLVKNKANSASLIKTHLYNVEQAYKRGGSDPLFVLDMDSLLEAKGYQRRSDGSFHPDTYRKEWGRLVTLSACWIELQPTQQGKKREGYIDTPYWQIEARYRLDDGESIGIQPFLLEDPEAPIIKQALIRPGLWWGYSDIGNKRFEIPRAVLALPTDGNGNETERYAVQLAATLAIWVRASQEQHAGETWGYSVGKLLEASGLKTREEFENMRTNQVGRLREYLAGQVGDDELRGAINLLTSLGAFDISIRDESEFWATGRGWTDQFWEAKLDVQIPNLGIKKSGYKPSKGRAKA